MKHEVFDLHDELEERHWWFVGRRQVVDPLIDRVMAGRERDWILDLGCGTGGMVHALAGRYRCLGIDSSRVAISKAEAAYPEARFRLGSVPDDLRDVAPDTALYLIMDVLEHIEDDRSFLADVVALARPGAHVLITVPALAAMWSRHDETAGHFRRYEKDQLAGVWHGLPVEPRVLTFYNSRLYPFIRTARTLGRLTGSTWGRSGCDFHSLPNPLNGVLAAVFGGERGRVAALYDDASGVPYRRGVSLLALLRRTPG